MAMTVVLPDPVAIFSAAGKPGLALSLACRRRRRMLRTALERNWGATSVSHIAVRGLNPGSRRAECR